MDVLAFSSAGARGPHGKGRRDSPAHRGRGLGPGDEVPPKSNRKDALYKLRHLVENGFLEFKQWRGVATRYAKNSPYLAICQIRAMARGNKPMGIRYHQVIDILAIGQVHTHPGQTEAEIGENAVARMNPRTGEIENLEVRHFQAPWKGTAR